MYERARLAPDLVREQGISKLALAGARDRVAFDTLDQTKEFGLPREKTFGL